MKDRMLDANFPRDKDGRTYHVGTKPGEVANRIIIVGDYIRAKRIAKSFDGGKALFEFESHRKFYTLTGTFQTIPITVIAIGMGFSLVDFFIRECRAIVQGDLLIVRLGSCGSLSNRANVGTVVVPFESIGVLRNYDHFIQSNNIQSSSSLPYTITKPLPCDKRLHDELFSALQATKPSIDPKLFDGNVDAPIALDNIKNASADSFYSSQGRQSDLFDDQNENLIKQLQIQHPDLQTFEMETYLLNHLAISANASKSVRTGNQGTIRTGAVQMVFANRFSQDFITPEQVEILELWTGKAVCQALISIPIEGDKLHGEGVWSKS